MFDENADALWRSSLFVWVIIVFSLDSFLGVVLCVFHMHLWLADTLFTKIQKTQHCLDEIFTEVETSFLYLRHEGHIYELRRCSLEIHKRSFILRCIFKFMQI